MPEAPPEAAEYTKQENPGLADVLNEKFPESRHQRPEQRRESNFIGLYADIRRPSEIFLGSPVTVTSRDNSLQISPELILGKLKSKEKMRTDRRYSS
ncbi:hypothetical protein DUI87_23885 [Hirundo rustica rustica]|uniref:Uncharacterized protein n=1 Tax=Hirundo rustica rustica TaxID=333673 RepID=A0A3M0JF99_HIRRU|nr:hypothetical protein DUI87_23885 [Hirundo rustica rustica]